MGAFGYIIKPFESNEVLINVANALRRRRLEMENRLHRDNLEDVVRTRTMALQQALEWLERSEKELRLSREETIQRLAIAAEYRDSATAQHIQRMSHYCELLARRYGLSTERCDLIRTASPMHDIGKIGTPDHVLLKPGKFTQDEFNVIAQHAEIGYRILAGSDAEIFNVAATIAFTHHERWDGSGYPRKLKGEAIPIEGRIAAIADAFDALTTARVYKPAFALRSCRRSDEQTSWRAFRSRTARRLPRLAWGYQAHPRAVCRPPDSGPAPPVIVADIALHRSTVSARFDLVAFR